MPTRELYVQGTQEHQLPGIEPSHWTTEDYRSRYWPVYVSYPYVCFAYLRGRSGGRVSGVRTWHVSSCALWCVKQTATNGT